MAFKNEITQMALELYPQIFQNTSKLELTETQKIAIGDSCAATMCKRWQEAVMQTSQHEIIKEANVAGNNPIDLLDLTDGIAYELKYSQKNVKHEFYKDLFKVLVYNEQVGEKEKLKTFVFLCHYKGISSLMNSTLCTATIQFMKKNGIEVELVELFPEEIISENAA